MLERVWVLISRDFREQDKILSVYSPDFDCELIKNETDRVKVNQDLEGFVCAALLRRERFCTEKKTFLTASELKQPIYSGLQRWEEFEIDIKYGFFTRIMPMTGHLANSISILTGEFPTYMALMIASSDQNESSSLSSNILSAVGTILDSTFQIIIFTFSPTSEMLFAVGKTMDNYLLYAEEESDDAEYANNKANNRTCINTINLVYLIAYALILADSVISAISLYEQNVLLIDNYTQLDKSKTESERDRDKLIIIWVTLYPFITCGLYSNIVWEAAFVNQLAEILIKKLNLDKDAKQQSTPPGLFFRSRLTKATINLHEHSTEERLLEDDVEQQQGPYRLLLSKI